MKDDKPRPGITGTLRQTIAYLEYLRSCGVDGLPAPKSSHKLAQGIGGPTLQGGGAIPETVTSHLPREKIPPAPFEESLESVREDLGDCRRCRLHTTRRQLVFGTGPPLAELMFIGEGPGEEEDHRGEPFVGPAGEYLTRIIAQGMGRRRTDVYITNIVKCRPPGNRDPESDEIATCLPFLDRQIRAVRPKVIITLGKPATSTLLGRSISITRFRGSWFEYLGVKVLGTYHPAYVLRKYTREVRGELWQDVKAAMRELGWSTGI